MLIYKETHNVFDKYFLKPMNFFKNSFWIDQLLLYIVFILCNIFPT